MKHVCDSQPDKVLVYLAPLTKVWCAQVGSDDEEWERIADINYCPWCSFDLEGEIDHA